MERPTPPRTVPRHSDNAFDAGRTMASMDFSMLFTDDVAQTSVYADPKHEQRETGYDTVTVHVRILRRMAAPRSALEFQLMKTLKNAVKKLGKGDVGDDAHVHSLKQHLTANGFPINESTTAGAFGSAALLNLRHTFLWLKPAVALDGLDFPEQRIILEPDIRAHFVISRATPNYQRLVDALPEQFVGTHQRLVELVEFMCEQMTASFRESAMSVPPWRQPKSILSKWFIPTAPPETSARSSAHAEVKPQGHNGSSVPIAGEKSVCQEGGHGSVRGGGNNAEAEHVGG